METLLEEASKKDLNSGVTLYITTKESMRSVFIKNSSEK